MTYAKRATGAPALAALAGPAAAGADPGHPSNEAPDSAADAAPILLLAPRSPRPRADRRATAPSAPRGRSRRSAARRPTRSASRATARHEHRRGLICKPAAGTLVALPNGKILYWDALEGTENNRFSIVTEGGKTFTNDAARLLDLGHGQRELLLDGREARSTAAPTRTATPASR